MRHTMELTGRLTAEDLLRPGTPYDRGELWDGAWVVHEPSGGPAEAVGSRLHAALTYFLRERDVGWVTGSSQGFYVRRDPDRVLSPDVAFTSYARLPEIPARGFIPIAPDFAVEVVSPDDTWDDMLYKAGVWVGHGTAVLWVVDPQTRRAAEVRPGATLRVLDARRTPDAELDASPALPGLRVALAGVFARLP